MSRVLIATTWFPDRAHPARTPFCLQHAHAIALSSTVEVVHIDLGAKGRPHRESYEGLTVHRVPHRLASLRSWWRLGSVLRAGLATSDVFHTMAFSSILMVAPFWSWNRRPWVHTEHWNGVTAPHTVPGPWRRLAFLRWALRLPHSVTAVTNQLADAMSRFARARAISVVPCVVPSVPVVPPPALPPLRLVAVGLLIERKDPLLAVDTIAEMHRRGVATHLTWVGDGPLRATIAGRICELGLDDAVELVGSVSPSDVSRYLQQAHLFFLPSRQENFFTAAAEAIVSGRPAIIPDVGGVSDYCTDDNSVIVRTTTAEAFADALLKAHQDFAGAIPADIAGTVGHRFSYEAVGAQFARLYAELVARTQHRA